MATRYAVVDESGVVFGIGRSGDAARNDASGRWSGRDGAYPAPQMRVVRCSELAYDYIKTRGYDRRAVSMRRTCVCLVTEEES